MKVLSQNNFNGKLRNIYGVNLISRDTFVFKIDGLFLYDWILYNHPQYCRELNPNLLLWFPPEEQINKIRDIFIKEDKIWEA